MPLQPALAKKQSGEVCGHSAIAAHAAGARLHAAPIDRCMASSAIARRPWVSHDRSKAARALEPIRTKLTSCVTSLDAASSSIEWAFERTCPFECLYRTTQNVPTLWLRRHQVQAAWHVQVAAASGPGSCTQPAALSNMACHAQQETRCTHLPTTCSEHIHTPCLHPPNSPAVAACGEGWAIKPFCILLGRNGDALLKDAGRQCPLREGQAKDGS